MTPARAMGAAALVLGLAAPFAGSPYAGARGRVDVAELTSAIARGDDQITATDLARWIRDRKAGLRVFDLRSAAAFGVYQVPTAENVPIDALERAPIGASDVVVLYGEGDAPAAQGWILLRARGHRDVFYLRGGLDAWIDEVMSPEKGTDLTEYFGGVPRPAGSPGAKPPKPASLNEKIARTARRGC